MNIPICVDLDYTLIKTDTLLELLLLCLKHKPIYLLFLPFWLMKGKAYFKMQLSNRISLDPSTMPYNEEVLAWLHEEKQKGKKLYLVTAAHFQVANKIADYLGIFDKVLANDGKINFKGMVKAEALAKQFGKFQFTYAGDSMADLPVFAIAKEVVVVQPSLKLMRRVKAITATPKIFPKINVNLKTWLKALRIHQYAKNFLILVPLLLSHQYTNLTALFACFLGIAAFSVTASSVYVLNDLLDLSNDRAHATKRNRPFASGALSIPIGIALFLSCLLTAIGFSYFLPLYFSMWLFIYYILTLAYSLHLKRFAILDVLILSLFYTLRITAGMSLIPDGYSHWLILFSIFFFTSLAFAKRYAELHELRSQNKTATRGRAYDVEHMALIANFGVSSSFLSVLIFTLYLNSSKASSLYHHPMVLYALCPFILYWVARIWLLSVEGRMHEDPIVFALRDKTTYFLGIIGIVIGIIAAW